MERLAFWLSTYTMAIVGVVITVVIVVAAGATNVLLARFSKGG